ncbi:UNVERIFIED_CONTAM: hypothetical protein PYX00_003692 [Menopon gallinae]|uniref:Zinc finger PHD-type domain-containing protein n=1 Tax=Menopon gallinae TaxID=328185 RepID=A0AAW2I1E8_9NEOP
MMDSEKPSEPDSTTLEKDVRQEFRKDEDVLCLNNKDGCFYLGTIVQVDTIYKKCLVEFLDNTKTWSSFKDLKSFAPQESDICYICKKSQSKSDNKIIVCKCGRACHQHCHEPVIENSDTTDWKCKICEPTIKRKDEKLTKRISSNKSVAQDGPPTSVSQLPYNPDTLTWDTHHRVNQERRYCYCGEDGCWNTKMLQCRRCRQWFHSRCTPSVTQPVFCGDRFYVFVCSLCNYGKEYSRRLALKWPDLVHLVLYNLTLIHQTKYYELEKSILPYLNEHWDEFNLPPSIAKATLEERRNNVLDALITCEKRFKCGREIKKRANIWGLRFRGAPKSPPLSLPPRGPIDDNVLKVYCKKYFMTAEAEFKPLQNGYINSSQTGSRQFSEKSEQKIVPPLVINVPKPYSTTMTYTVSDKDVTTKLNDNLTTDSKVISSTEYHGRGLVKRSTPFPPQDQANNLDTRFRSHAIRKARRLLNKNMKRKKKTVQTSVPSPKASSDSSDEKNSVVSQKKFSDSFDEFVQLNNNKMHLRKRISQPEIRKRPQRNLLEARLNSTESKLYNPFVSVDSSEMRKSRTASQDNNRKSLSGESAAKKAKPLKGKSNNEKLKGGKTKYVQKSIYESFNVKLEEKPKLELVPVASKFKFKDSDSGEVRNVKTEKGSGRWELERGHGESDLGVDSTDDETSSRGTLEPFIPTPKDFEGQNNPFRSVTELINTAAGVAPATTPPITLPLPLKTVIPHIDPPRLKKRQLSEKDIIIDRNGQVKRRRRHRKNLNGLIQRTLTHGTAAKSAQIVPSRNTKKHWPEKQTLQPLANNCIDYNARQLRNRDSLKAGEKQPTPTKPASVKCSPSKESATLTEDLESSVKYFFGTASRIANGEKYEIRAKRITFDGRLQCIIDWKSYPT